MVKYNYYLIWRYTFLNYKIPDYFGPTFYEDIQEALPSSILDFWGMRNFYHICQNTTYEAFIIDTLDNTFHDVDRSKLADHISKLKATQRRRRLDWYNTYYSYMEYDIRDVQHPLAAEYLITLNLPPAEFIKQYKDKSLDEVMQEKIAQKNQTMDEWKKNRDSLFTQYPAFPILTEKQKEHTLSYDIIATACNYIAKTIKYRFDENIKSMPSPIVSKPIFSLSSTKIALEEINGIVQSVINKKGGSTFSVVPVGDTSELTTLNKYDYDVYQALTKLAESDGKESEGRLVLRLSYHNLASKLYNYTINTNDVEKVKKSVAKLAARRFIYKQDTTFTEYVLIDSISYDLADNNQATITLGSVVSDAITQKNLISISKRDEERIETKYAKSFMHSLQKLRFILHRDNPNDLTTTVSIEFFEDSVFFNTKSYKKKISIIIEALDDYVSHEVLVHEFKYTNDKFTITFLPLGKTDIYYYNEWLKVNKSIH